MSSSLLMTADIAPMDKRVCVYGLWPDGLELYPRRHAVACPCVEVWVLLCYSRHNVSLSHSLSPP